MPAHAPASSVIQECDHPREQREEDRTCQHPGGDGDGTAGDERPEKPAEQDLQHSPHDDRKEYRDGNHPIEPLGSAGPSFFGFRQRLAVDHAEDPVDPGGDAAVEIPLPEPRHDDLADDALAGGVGERPFQAVPHLDPQRPVVLRHDEKRPVIHVLPPRFPLLRNAQRVLFDRLRRGGGNDENRNLAALRGFERPQGLFQGGFLFIGERSGQVGDAPANRGNRNLCAGDDGPAERDRQQGRPCRPHLHPLPCPLSPVPPYGFVGAGAKSTLGGLETSFSFSTVKLGLVLYPNAIAVRLEGKDRTVTLYSCTALM